MNRRAPTGNSKTNVRVDIHGDPIDDMNDPMSGAVQIIDASNWTKINIDINVKN